MGIKKGEEASLILRHLLLSCGEFGLIPATFYKARASGLTDIAYRHAVQCRGGPRGLQVDITFNGPWQWPLRDGQQRWEGGRGGGQARQGRSLTSPTRRSAL